MFKLNGVQRKIVGLTTQNFSFKTDIFLLEIQYQLNITKNAFILFFVNV